MNVPQHCWRAWRSPQHSRSLAHNAHLSFLVASGGTGGVKLGRMTLVQLAEVRPCPVLADRVCLPHPLTGTRHGGRMHD